MRNEYGRMGVLRRMEGSDGLLIELGYDESLRETERRFFQQNRTGYDRRNTRQTGPVQYIGYQIDHKRSRTYAGRGQAAYAPRGGGVLRNGWRDQAECRPSRVFFWMVTSGNDGVESHTGATDDRTQ